jgi:hypothetical protein
VRFADGVRRAWPILREGAKYAPAARGVYDAVKDPVTHVVKGRRDRMIARRDAYREAETVVDGSVLLILKLGQPRWVVYSGDQPIAVHPFAPGDDLKTLTAYADLARRETPEQRRERLIQARVRRAATRGRGVEAIGRGRRRGGSGG